MGGVFTRLIERNTTIPCKKSQIFSTAADSQPAVSVHVLQGEREMASANRTLGRFDLIGLPPAPRGVPQIEVSFDIDANGIVHVGAKDLGTGKEQKIRIESSSGLSDSEIEKMVHEAKEHEAEDKAKRELIDVKNQADGLIYSTEKTLKDSTDKISEEDKKKIEDEIANLKSKTTGDSVEDIKKATEELQQSVFKMSENLYQQKEEPQQQQEEKKSEQAEYRVVNE